MRDEHHGLSPLIDVSAVSLLEMRKVDSAALRAVLASCLADDKDQIASFNNSI
jgi:FXSXX-COOH protein